MDKNIKFSIGEEIIGVKRYIVSGVPEGYDLIGCPTVVVGKKYIVNGIKYCQNCGVQWVNVEDTPLYPCDIQCNDCKHVSSSTDSLIWTESHYFRRIEDIEESIEECVTEERYEDASLLHSLSQELLNK